MRHWIESFEMSVVGVWKLTLAAYDRRPSDTSNSKIGKYRSAAVFEITDRQPALLSKSDRHNLIIRSTGIEQSAVT